MRYTLLLLIVVAAVLPWGLAGCDTASSEATLVGTWRTDGSTGMGFTYVFASDGSMKRAATMGDMTNPEPGTWQIVDSDGESMTIACTFKIGRRGGMTSTEDRSVRFLHAEHISITLGMDQAREAITAIALPTAAKGHVGLVQHHTGGGMERMQSSAA